MREISGSSQCSPQGLPGIRPIQDVDVGWNFSSHRSKVLPGRVNNFFTMSKERRENEELKNRLQLRESLDEERGESDRRYAIKLVEKIVFILVGLLLTGVITALINLVLKRP